MISVGSSPSYFSLYHIASSPARGSSFQGWLSTAQLGLHGTLGLEWTTYVQGLKLGAITLNSSSYEIRWSYDPVGGMISAKLAYQSLLIKDPT